MFLGVRILDGLGTGEQYQKPQDDIAKGPYGDNYPHAESSSDSHTSTFRIGGSCVHMIADGAERRKEPNDHQDIKDDKAPFENLTHKAACWLPEYGPAARAFECLVTDAIVTLRAADNGHDSLLLLYLSEFYNKVRLGHCAPHCEAAFSEAGGVCDEDGAKPDCVPDTNGGKLFVQR